MRTAKSFFGQYVSSVAGTLGHATPMTTKKIYSHFYEAAKEKKERLLLKSMVPNDFVGKKLVKNDSCEKNESY